MAFKRRDAELISRIDQVGWLAILLVLFFVIMFVRTGYMNPHARSHPMVDTVKVRHVRDLTNTEREDTVYVTITRDSHMFYGFQQVDKAERIAPLLRQDLQTGIERRVYLNVDYRSRYGDTKRVLDQVRDAGVEDVSFLAQEKRQ